MDKQERVSTIDKAAFFKYNDRDFKVKFMTDREKTIIAIATPAGTGAIGIIRISGKNAREGVNRIFSRKLTTPRRMEFGVIEAGEYRDEAMAVYFEEGKSYTGEESVEIYCHGSYALLNGIVDYAVDNLGFTYAEGGDFTARAFMNGKMDLTEAEGVCDIINAVTTAELRGAFSLLTGGLRSRIEDIQKKIVTARSVIEAPLDYPEEEVEEETTEEVKKRIYEIKKELGELISTYKSGRLIRDGVSVALAGKPNAGKSSLMNALLGYDRAIVTAEKGTTRDTLTESYVYRGVRFNLTDTAGIREAESLPEKMGVERAENAVKQADVTVVVIDAGEDNKDFFIDEIRKKACGEVIVAENKTDLYNKEKEFSLGVSALKGTGTEELKEAIFKASGVGAVGAVSLNNARQNAAATESYSAVLRALDACDEYTLDVVSMELYEAFTALGKITGITGSDALAEEIFKNFCVGK